MFNYNTIEGFNKGNSVIISKRKPKSKVLTGIILPENRALNPHTRFQNRKSFNERIQQSVSVHVNSRLYHATLTKLPTMTTLIA